MSDRYNGQYMKVLPKTDVMSTLNKITSSLDDIARDDLHKVLISTEPSPNKICNYKIDEVRSPEVRKCRLSLQSSISQSGVKSRKKLKTRYSEPRKLPVNFVRVPKNLQEVQAKKQLAKFYTGSEDSLGDVHVLNLTDVTKTTNVEPSTSVTVAADTTSQTKNTAATSQTKNTAATSQTKNTAATSQTKNTAATSHTILNDLEIPEITKLSVEIRSSLIQNVDSPRKQIESNFLLPYELLTKSDCEVGSPSVSDHVVQSDCLSASKFLKETPVEHSEVLSENVEIFSSPDVMRMRRKRKLQPGSLLDRYHVVSSKLQKDKVLFSYEMEAGLRMNSGQFVTCDLIVKSLTKHHGFQILRCKSTSKICEDNNNILSYEILVISKYLAHKVNVNSVIKLHFPFTVMLDAKLNAIIVLARNRIVLQEKHAPVQIDDGTDLSKEYTYDGNLFSCKTFELSIVRVINSSITTCIHECLLAQSLVFYANLEIILLHLFKSRLDTWTALTCDKECHYCLIEFNSDQVNLDIAKLMQLEGCKINITGIKIIDFISIDSTMAELINFVHKDMKNCETIYKAEVFKENVDIVCLHKCLWPKMFSNISYILAEDKDFKRYSVKVEWISTSCRGLCVSDASLHRAVLLNCTHPFLFTELRIPFIVDAVFYLKGELFADIYSKMMNV